MGAVPESVVKIDAKDGRQRLAEKQPDSLLAITTVNSKKAGLN